IARGWLRPAQRSWAQARHGGSAEHHHIAPEPVRRRVGLEAAAPPQALGPVDHSGPPRQSAGLAWPNEPELHRGQQPHETVPLPVAWPLQSHRVAWAGRPPCAELLAARISFWTPDLQQESQRVAGSWKPQVFFSVCCLVSTDKKAASRLT